MEGERVDRLPCRDIHISTGPRTAHQHQALPRERAGGRTNVRTRTYLRYSLLDFDYYYYDK
eukprot:scaffold22530_cov27-Tisochrysis_lutea.AAC.1